MSSLSILVIRTALACWLVLVSGSVTLALAQASAITPRAADARESARVEGRLGIADYNRGDYAGAVRHFRRAVRLFEYPTLWLYLARSLERTHRIVEATRAYASLLASAVDSSEGAIEADARSAARHELSVVAARQAALTLVLAAKLADVVIEVNNTSWPRERLGQPTAVDPGPYTIRVSRRGRLIEERHLTVEEGSRHSIGLLATLGTRPRSSSASPALPARAAAGSDSRGWSLPLIVSSIASAAFTIGAVATGVLSVERQSEFDTLNRSETSLKDRSAAHAHALRMQLLNAVCVGGAVLGGGATLFFLLRDGTDTPTAARGSRSASAPSSLYVGLTGRF